MGRADRAAVTTARVFDIQRFSVHDGPGIRSTVFFKGCPLRCRWCHNPESISSALQYLVYPGRCTSCGICPGMEIAGSSVGSSPTAGITDSYARCPYGAREVAGSDRSIEELADAATRDLPFYGDTGGVTISGGEPLAQWEAASALAQSLRRRGAHVAVDTSAYVPFDVISALPETFDLVIVDLKAVDPDWHREWTGVDNGSILDAIRYLAATMGDRLWISVPAVPGVQLGSELDRIEEFILSLGPGPKARLIPYHRFGQEKYRALGVDPPKFSADPSDELPAWQDDANVPVSLVE